MTTTTSAARSPAPSASPDLASEPPVAHTATVPAGSPDASPRGATASSRRARPSALASDLATMRVLVERDLRRFLREKSRIVGALLQPLLLWLVIGSGLGSTFRLPGAESHGYLQYFFPGVVAMVVLFTTIFQTMTVIEDRHQGFLQAVLSAPGSRVAVVAGKCLAVSVIAGGQALVVLAMAPLAGYPLAGIDVPLVVASVSLFAFALASVGFAVAWLLDSTQGYHVVMSLVLIPAWILSGAMYPATGSATIGTIMALNPMSYALAALRRGLGGPGLPSVALPPLWAPDLLVLAAFALVGFALATLACTRRR